MAIAAGHAHLVAIDERGRVWTWGQGAFGRLGQGDDEDQPEPALVAPAEGLRSPVMVSAGWHTAVLASDGESWLCGAGDFGQLGHGDSTSKLVLTRLSKGLFGKVPLMMVACGGSHTVALTQMGSVWTFGNGADGQLGLGESVRRMGVSQPMLVSGELQDIVVEYVAAGFAFSLAVSEAGEVFTWGKGADGRLGHDDEEDQVLPRAVGRERFGGGKVVQVAAGVAHSAALTTQVISYHIICMYVCIDR